MWHIPETPALGRLRQKGYEFKISLNCKVRSYTKKKSNWAQRHFFVPLCLVPVGPKRLSHDIILPSEIRNSAIVLIFYPPVHSWWLPPAPWCQWASKRCCRLDSIPTEHDCTPTSSNAPPSRPSSWTQEYSTGKEKANGDSLDAGIINRLVHNSERVQGARCGDYNSSNWEA